MAADPSRDDEFWEDPERVERFASRDPDQWLVELVQRYPDPTSTVVLDLGCAGGRNTELLARRGFQVHAVDAARAMVQRTRQRLARVVGADIARERVVRGRMDDLRAHADDVFDLIVALGVHHSARTRAEWERAMDELARVLKPGGLLLSAARGFRPLTPTHTASTSLEPGRRVSVNALYRLDALPGKAPASARQRAIG
jgi:SAM-dependent methyltransferase